MADSNILCANIGTLCEIIDAWKASEICTTPCGSGTGTDTNTQYTLSIASGSIILTPDDGGDAQTIDLCTSLIECGFAREDSNLDAVEANDGTLVITLTDGTGAVTTESIILTEHPTIANAFNLTMAGKTAIIQDTTYTLAATGAAAPTSITLTSSTGVESVVDLCPLVQACDPTTDIDQVTTDGNGSVTITLTDHEGTATTQTISVTQDPVNTNVYNLNIGGVTHQISQIRYVIEASTTSDTSIRLTPDDGSIATEVDLCPIIANCTADTDALPLTCGALTTLI